MGRLLTFSATSSLLIAGDSCGFPKPSFSGDHGSTASSSLIVGNSCDSLSSRLCLEWCTGSSKGGVQGSSSSSTTPGNS
ncbi:unnamed protein product [Meloidogyne enterolobii]|uniref:Uncharacterized protein n=1 Tax=Meloidogyne enterolobii TaxID=390850 RepID=A0ACB0YEE7_MELEN